MKRTFQTTMAAVLLTSGLLLVTSSISPAGPPRPIDRLGPPSAPAVSPPRPEILIVGTYHMANPGHDIFNTKADDVLAPKRQAEIAELLAVLKRFRPTKIAVESAVYDDTRRTQYSDYLAGKHTLSRNEIEQVGFRLAKELGMAAIYPVDYDGDFPWQRVINFAKAKGQSSPFDQLVADMGQHFGQQGPYLAAHTILETLLFMNADERVATDVGFYYREVHFGEPGDYAGPDLLTSWYQRNMRIYNNITALIGSPDERILVIYGAGHLGWLRLAAESDPTVQLRKLAEFAAPLAK
jgi:hypothetical protein